MQFFLHFALVLFRKKNPTSTATGGARKESAGRTGRDIRGTAIARWDDMERAEGQRVHLLLFFVLSTLLVYSDHSSSFPIVSFSAEYNNRGAGRDGPTRATMTTSDGTEMTGRHDRYILCYSFSSYCPLFFFSLFLSLLSRTAATDGAGPSGTGQDGTTRAATAMQTGRGPGRRR